MNKEAERIILDRAKDRLIDVVYRAENAEEYARMARGALNYFYEQVVFSALDLGVRSGKALDMGTQFGLCAVSLAKQDYAFEITSFQDSVKTISISRKFTGEDMTEEKIKWVLGRQESLPFEDHAFDLVVSGFDMHHWEDPVQVFNEIERVVKKNGVILIADLRRSAFSPMIPFVKAISYLVKREKIYSEMERSFGSSYNRSEIAELLKSSRLRGCEVTRDAQFIYIRKAVKPKKHIIAEFSSQ